MNKRTNERMEELLLISFFLATLRFKLFTLRLKGPESSHQVFIFLWQLDCLLKIITTKKFLSILTLS